MLNRLPHLLMFAAAVLTGLGGWSAWRNSRPAEPEPAFVVELPVADVGRVVIGPHEVVVRVTNPAERTRLVMGMMAGCRENCCFHTGEDGPVSVSPSATVSYRCVLDVCGSGPFEVPLVLFFEDNGIRYVELTARGIGVANEGPANVSD